MHQDSQDQPDPKDQMAILFKGHLDQLEQKEKGEKVDPQEYRGFPDQRGLLDVMDLKDNGEVKEKMAQLAHKDLLAQWVHQATQDLPVFPAAQDPRVIMDQRVLQAQKEKEEKEVTPNPRTWCVSLLGRCVSSSSKVTWQDSIHS